MSFEVADYCVFFCTIAISFGIGIFFAVWERKRNTLANYFLADRKARTWPVALSFIVTFQSSIMILGFPAEGYAYGIGIAYYVIGCSAAYLFTAIFIVPVFHPLKLTSVNEYFYLRYGNNVVRYMTLITGLTYTLFYMASVMIGTCYALDVVIGIPFWGTILIYTVVTTVYTSVGGIKAVIWTDVFQLAVMVTGIIAVLIQSTNGAGGIEQMFKLAKDRIDATDFRLDPTIRYQVWSISFGAFCGYLYITLMQPTMQRIYSTPTVKSARTLFLISTPLYAVFMAMTAFEGVTIFGYFAAKHCDILNGGIIDNINEIIPFAIIDLFQNMPGLSGLFIASLSSAALSTMSSCLSSLSAVTYEDIIKVKFPNMHSYRATNLSKLIVLLYGLIVLGVAFAISFIPGSIVAIFDSFMGCISGPIAATFLLSLMFRKATSTGVITGAVCGSAVTFWVNLGSIFSGVPKYPYLPPGPTDQCSVYEKGSTFSNSSMTSTETSTYFTVTNLTFASPSAISSIMNSSTTSIPSDTEARSPLETIYSISYVMFSLIGMVTSLIVGFAVSLCTRPPKIIDERCLFSFRKHILSDLCGFESTNDAKKEAHDEEEITNFMARDVAI